MWVWEFVRHGQGLTQENTHYEYDAPRSEVADARANDLHVGHNDRH
jgi:hypothetical protein